MEKAARAERKRALVDMNAHETQEGVMDSLMEALQTGSAFSRPDQRRKRQTRVAGGKFKIVRNTKFTTIKFIKRRYDQQTKSRNVSYSKSKLSDYELLEDKLYSKKSNRASTLPNKKGDYYTPEDNKDFKKQMMMKEAMRTPKKDKVVYQLKTKAKDEVFLQKEMLCTPEENQSLFKEILLSCAKKAPKKEEIPSRISRIYKNKSSSRIEIPSRSSMLEETPRREVSMSVSLSKLQDFNQAYLFETPPIKDTSNLGTFPKYFSQNSAYELVLSELRNWTPDRFRLSPSSEQSVERFSRKENLNEVYGETPVRKKIMASKTKKRNSIVRRAAINRKRISQHHWSKKKLSKHWHSFPNISVSPPNNFDSSNSKFTESCDNISRLEDLKSYEFYLARIKNFENIIDVKDENENLVLKNSNDSEATQFSPSPCSKSILTEDLGKSPYNENISGVLEMSNMSSPRFLNPETYRKIILSDKDSPRSQISKSSSNWSDSPQCLETFSSPLKFYKGSIVPQIEGKKKTWKLWRKFGNSTKFVPRKYSILQTTETDDVQKNNKKESNDKKGSVTSGKAE